MKYQFLFLFKVTVFVLVNSFITVTSFSDTLFDKQFGDRVKQAQTGNKRAQYKLGIAYLNGSQVKVDVGRAIYWLKKSASQNYVKAMHKLGMIYFTNKAGSKNQKQAFRWFAKAADLKYSESAYYMAKIYFDGKLVNKDNERAMHWAVKAKQYGAIDADKIIKAISGSGFKPNVKKLAATTEKKKADRKIIRKIVAKDSKSNTKNIKQGKPSVSKEMIYKSNWLLSGKPAEHMPSQLHKCIPKANQVSCKSNTIIKNNFQYKAHVEIETTLKNFTPTGSFAVDYRLNYLLVNPQNGSKHGDEDVPKLGWQKSINKLRCRLIEKNLLRCFTDDLRVERYYRK